MVLFEGGTRGVDCPEDSIRGENGECKCAAIDCPSVECQAGQRPMQVQPADPETPGSCCARYDCVPTGKRSNWTRYDAANRSRGQTPLKALFRFVRKTLEDPNRVRRTACSPRMENASARPARRLVVNSDIGPFKSGLPSIARRLEAVAHSTSVDSQVIYSSLIVLFFHPIEKRFEKRDRVYTGTHRYLLNSYEFVVTPVNALSRTALGCGHHVPSSMAFVSVSDYDSRGTLAPARFAAGNVTRVRFPAPQTRLFVDTSNLSTTGYSLESVHRPRPGVLLRINDEERVIAYVDTCNVHRRFRLPRRARLSDKSGDRDAKGGRILYLRGQGEKVGRTMATVGLRKLRLSGGRCILSRTDVQVLRKCDSSRSWRVLSSLSAAYERDVSRTPTALSNIVGRMRVNVPEWLRHGRK